MTEVSDKGLGLSREYILDRKSVSRVVRGVCNAWKGHAVFLKKDSTAIIMLQHLDVEQ